MTSSTASKQDMPWPTSQALDSDATEKAGKVGWLAKGVLYFIVGLLAIDVARSGGGSGEEASQTGALAEVASTSYGTILLAILGAGLLLYGLWKAVRAFLPGDQTAKGVGKRVVWLGSGIVYVFLAVTAFSIAFGGGSSSGSGGGGESWPESLTSTLLENSFGQILVAAVGLAFIIGGIVIAVWAYKEKFLEKMETGRMSATERTWSRRLGIVGYIARGIVYGLIGGFFIQAAMTANPDDAKGLGGALADVAGSTGGSILIWIVAVGLVLYGIFAVVSARFQELERP
ncbi:MAG: DUF1206 domain-containing protein [Actinomycetota bacterium]|nr:DUF1206 domain-containing protein [Actinomycetota bacterium]